jgi:hypothetical protein
LWLQKNVRQLIFNPSSFVVVSEIRDGLKSGSGINIPDPQHWKKREILIFYAFCDALNDSSEMRGNLI